MKKICRMNSKMRKQVWKNLMVRFGNQFTCFYCQKEVIRSVHPNAPNRATIDHIVARCLGGTNAQSNLVISCLKCNKRKSVFENYLFQMKG